MDTLDGRLAADFACLDPVYIDGIAGVMNLGTNFATLYYRWVPKHIENGKVIFDMSPALYLVRPYSSVVCTQDCRLKQWVNGGRPPVLGDHRTLQ